MNNGKMIGPRSVLAVLFSFFALTLLTPSTVNAQVTVKHVQVTIGGSTTVVYCDVGLACANPLWNLGTGQLLSGGQTLVLTQTGSITSSTGEVGANFDTSDRVQRPPNPFTTDCSPSSLCTTKVEIDTGSGLTAVYNPPSGTADPLNNFNLDDGSLTHNEASPYIVAYAAPNYTLSLGYADNVHSPGLCGNSCFPSPFTNATYFRGAGIGKDGDCTGNCYDAGVLMIAGLTVPRSLSGRMTGGGSVFTSSGERVTHGFELHCSILDTPNSLEINWDKGNNFHLTALTSVTCIDDPNITPPPPNAGFDTLIATGVGTLNGQPAIIEFTLTDAGEPGTSDTAKYRITQGSLVLDVGPALLTKGNQQAHKN